MACIYGNCNDANCAAGSDSDVNGNPCDDASCAPCGSVAVTGGVPATTVAPNPTIVAANASGTQLSQVTNSLGQWGATITALATGQPTIIGASGARTGVAAATPGQLAFNTTSSIPILLLVVGIVVVVLIIGKR